MIIRKAFKFRLYPTAEQGARLSRWQDALRFLWNLANEQRLIGMARPHSERRYYSGFDQMRQLGELRAALPWLADVPRNACEDVLARLDRAWRLCFARAGGEPRWKRKGQDVVSIREGHSDRRWRLSGANVIFPKIGPIRAVVHRVLDGKLRSCSIIRDADQWFAAVLCEIEAPDPAPRPAPMVALDRGVINSVADSDGNLVPSPRFYNRSLRRLARAQRVVARRQKGSANREKAKLRVARLHRKIRRQREHFIHGLSTAYAKSHGTVVVENLNVAGMVHASRGLSRGILDAGWSRLVDCLKYKLARSGGRIVEVPAAYSSQTCSACGVVDAASRRSQSAFRCTSCGHEEHADLNAAKVLLLRANRPLMPVEVSAPKAARRSRKPKWITSPGMVAP